MAVGRGSPFGNLPASGSTGAAGTNGTSGTGATDRGHGLGPDWRTWPWEQFSRHLVIDGRRVHLVDVGDGPAVVFIHGLASSWQWWLETIPSVVAGGYRTVAIDLPGFGDSEMPRQMTHQSTARCIDEVCEALGLGAVTLVGHSMGTVVAPEVASRYPERVSALVLVGGPPISVLRLFHSPLKTLREHPETSSFLIEVATAGFPVTPFARRQIAQRGWLRKLIFRPYVPRADLLAPDLIYELLGGIGTRGVFPAIRNGFGYDFEETLRSLRCRILVVGGTLDKVTPRRDLDEFSTMTPIEQVEVMDGTGHWPMLERPGAFTKVLVEFIPGPAMAGVPADLEEELPA